MSIYNLTAQVTISIYTKVEAETLEEAIKIAEDRSIESGGLRPEDIENECWVATEYDGMPSKIKEEN